MIRELLKYQVILLMLSLWTVNGVAQSMGNHPYLKYVLTPYELNTDVVYSGFEMRNHAGKTFLLQNLHSTECWPSLAVSRHNLGFNIESGTRQLTIDPKLTNLKKASFEMGIPGNYQLFLGHRFRFLLNQNYDRTVHAYISGSARQWKTQQEFNRLELDKTVQSAQLNFGLKYSDKPGRTITWDNDLLVSQSNTHLSASDSIGSLNQENKGLLLNSKFTFQQFLSANVKWFNTLGASIFLNEHTGYPNYRNNYQQIEARTGIELKRPTWQTRLFAFSQFNGETNPFVAQTEELNYTNTGIHNDLVFFFPKRRTNANYTIQFLQTLFTRSGKDIYYHPVLKFSRDQNKTQYQLAGSISERTPRPWQSNPMAMYSSGQNLNWGQEPEQYMNGWFSFKANLTAAMIFKFQIFHSYSKNQLLPSNSGLGSEDFLKRGKSEEQSATLILERNIAGKLNSNIIYTYTNLYNEANTKLIPNHRVHLNLETYQTSFYKYWSLIGKYVYVWPKVILGYQTEYDLPIVDSEQNFLTMNDGIFGDVTLDFRVSDRLNYDHNWSFEIGVSNLFNYGIDPSISRQQIIALDAFRNNQPRQVRIGLSKTFR